MFIISLAYDERSEGEVTGECLKDIIYVCVSSFMCAHIQCAERSLLG